MKNRTMLNYVVMVGVLGIWATTASAQDTAAAVAAQASSLPKGFAGASFQVPSASGSGWGGVGFGVYAQTVDTPTDDYDGSAGLNIGLGDPAKYVGLDVSLSLSSLTGNNGSTDSFGDAGSFGAKLHTNLPGLMSFAVGVQSIGRFGAAKANKASVYSALSKSFVMGTQGLSATVGVGDTAFAVTSNGVGAFGSLAWYFCPQISVIGEYTGRLANAGISVAPFRRIPFTITAAALDLNDRLGSGTQVGLSAGLGFSF